MFGSSRGCITDAQFTAAGHISFGISTANLIGTGGTFVGIIAKRRSAVRRDSLRFGEKGWFISRSPVGKRIRPIFLD
jgi:hypothetical protein